MCIRDRLYGIKDGTGAKVEFLLLTHREGDTWEGLTGPGKRAKPGTHFTFGDGLLRADVLDLSLIHIWNLDEYLA